MEVAGFQIWIAVERVTMKWVSISCWSAQSKSGWHTAIDPRELTKMMQLKLQVEHSNCFVSVPVHSQPAWCIGNYYKGQKLRESRAVSSRCSVYKNFLVSSYRVSNLITDIVFTSFSVQVRHLQEKVDALRPQRSRVHSFVDWAVSAFRYVRQSRSDN
jgi:hypothetical protein